MYPCIKRNFEIHPKIDGANLPGLFECLKIANVNSQQNTGNSLFNICHSDYPYNLFFLQLAYTMYNSTRFSSTTSVSNLTITFYVNNHCHPTKLKKLFNLMSSYEPLILHEDNFYRNRKLSQFKKRAIHICFNKRTHFKK